MQHFKGMESLKLFNHVEECPLLSSISIIMCIDALRVPSTNRFNV